MAVIMDNMTTARVQSRKVVTLEQVREWVSTFEAEHPGYNSTNYVDAFRTEDGELQETEEFFKVDGWYTLLDMAR